MNDAPPGRDTAPASLAELLDRLDRIDAALPKRLRQCARATRQNLGLIAVSTVAEMAALSDVAPSAYMRFCQTLGFSGYSEMQALFRADYRQLRPGYGERLARLREDSRLTTGQLLADFAEAGHKSLLEMANTVASDRLEAVAQGLARARIVHLVGMRRAYPVVSCMTYLFEKMEVPSIAHGRSGLIGSAQAVLPGDAVFAVTFAPFSAETVEIARDAADRDVPVYGLSDTVDGPLSEIAAEVLIAREHEVGSFRAPTAAMVLVTSLAVAVGGLRQGS